MDDTHPVVGLGQLIQGRHAAITWALLVCGIGWGLVNFGFLLWLPTNLKELGVDGAAASMLLARSAILALPGIVLVVLLYQRWSSFKALVLFNAMTALTLLWFALLGMFHIQSAAITILATASLLISVSGVIAMLIPYAAEIYPVHLRGSGSGLIAASSKFGGILGTGLAILSFFDHFIFSAALLAIPMAVSAWMLWSNGIETRGIGLEGIQQSLRVQALSGDQAG